MLVHSDLAGNLFYCPFNSVILPKRQVYATTVFHTLLKYQIFHLLTIYEVILHPAPHGKFPVVEIRSFMRESDI
jgi:hypothetical protein